MRRAVRLLSIAWLTFIALFCLLLPLVSSRSPFQPIGQALSPPGDVAPLGTDELGRDLLTRLAYGGRFTLSASLIATALTLAAGGIAGLLAAMLGGVPDRILLWASNAMLAIPGLLVAMMLAAALGPSPLTIILAVGLGEAPAFTRTSRAVFAQIRRLKYISAARALGAGEAWIAVRHVLPNAITQLLPLATTHFAWALTGITTLSFLGLGGDPSLPEWGAILNAGRAFLRHAPWLALFPGVAISLTILSMHYLGSGQSGAELLGAKARRPQEPA
jgi:peptide/nickel transport system permease protein